MSDHYIEIEEYYRDHGWRVLKRLNRAVGTHAEDVWHNAIERALIYGATRDKSREIGAWLNTIIRNCIRDHWAAERGRNEEELNEYDEAVNNIEEQRNELAEEIISEIKQYPEVQKEMLMRVFFGGYSITDLGRLYPFSYYESYKLVNQFRSRMRRIYGKKEGSTA